MASVVGKTARPFTAPVSTRAVRCTRVSPVAPARQHSCIPVRALEIDWSDPDTQISLAGVVLGLVAGIGAPLFYASRADKDAEKLEELRALNRATFKETGEYLSEAEIAKFRKPKWTDRKEWTDDD